MKRLLQTLALLLTALLVPMSATVAYAASIATTYAYVGDVNSDGSVNMDDLTAMINYLLTDDATGINLTYADTNQSGGVGMDDLSVLINYLLTNQWPWDIETKTFTVNGVTFKMVAVNGGTFSMGATEEQGSNFSNGEGPVHDVTLSSFYIGETEVTQALWLAVMGSNPSRFTPANGYTENLQRPVEMVSWNDCQEFIVKLNQMTGKHFRLPTEAEWEYAARGGNKSQGYLYAGSNVIEDVAWYEVNAYNVGSSSPNYGPHTVATKAPNELGLYDMSGNVNEWCQDWFNNRYYNNCFNHPPTVNPTGPTSGTVRVNRGSSWSNTAERARVCRRDWYSPSGSLFALGLRLAVDEDNSSKFRFSETVLELEVGETVSVNMINGSGGYTVAGGTYCVNSTVDGETLTIVGTAAGTNTVHVTDSASGVTIALVVIVKPV